MKFCTYCGGVLIGKWIEADQRQRKVCCACGATNYENPRMLVWCYLYWKNMIVFCRRAVPPAEGLWAPPAGFVENGETLEDAVIREVEEETGLRLDVVNVHLFRVTSIPHMNQVYVEFRSKLTSPPNFRLGPEVLETSLFAQANVPMDQLAFADMLPDYPGDFFQCITAAKFPIRSVTVTLPVARTISTVQHDTAG